MMDDDRARLAAFRRQIRESTRIFDTAYRIRDRSKVVGKPVVEIECHLTETGRTVLVLTRFDGGEWQAIGELASADPCVVEARIYRALATIGEDPE